MQLEPNNCDFPDRHSPAMLCGCGLPCLQGSCVVGPGGEWQETCVKQIQRYLNKTFTVGAKKAPHGCALQLAAEVVAALQRPDSCPPTQHGRPVKQIHWWAGR